MRGGVAVGQVYELPDPGGQKMPLRRLRVVSVVDGVAACEVLVWKGRPRMKGMRAMLPDDVRYVLLQGDPDASKAERRRRRKGVPF